MKISRYFNLILAIFLLANLIVIIIQPVFVDPGLYWLYGAHLRWTYLDAPPLVGVVTYFTTVAFGHHAWVINALSFVSILISAYFLYLTAALYYEKPIAKLCALVWLLTPAITHFYLRFDWSYHNLISVF